MEYMTLRRHCYHQVTTVHGSEIAVVIGARMKEPHPDCPLGECTMLISGTWTPNIIWYVADEPRRFSDLKRALTGISSKVLTTRLRKLERDGVVLRTVKPSSPPTVTYELTELGRELRPVIDAIVDVGRRLKESKLKRLEDAQIQLSSSSPTGG
tara:strand:- start:164998 stop:165459 length:462 start_codon:yes stop_codon:yes gene_type:complete